MIDPPDPARTSSEEFDLLVRTHHRRVAGVVARLLDDPRDIEEVVQDTFVQAWRHRDRFREEAAVFTWLYRIATNAALMRLRRRRPITVSIDELDAAGLGSDDPIARAGDRIDDRAVIRDALAELSDHQRVIVLLRDGEGLSNQEVADTLGMPLAAVKAHLHRGRHALRRRLHDGPAVG
ncbi:MAG: RNA polymerase sigma factor [Acidimicrobiales bacterium]